MSSSLIKIAGAIAGIAVGAIVLHSQITKPAGVPEAAPESAPEHSFEEKVVGFLVMVGGFSSYVANLADEGIKAITAPAAESAAPESV
jgi:hypothetical protein